jgi:hypothetical protein
MLEELQAEKLAMILLKVRYCIHVSVEARLKKLSYHKCLI